MSDYTKEELLEMAEKTEKDLELSYKFNSSMLGPRLIKKVAFSSLEKDTDQVRDDVFMMVMVEVARLNQLASNIPRIKDDIINNNAEGIDQEYFENTFIENQQVVKTYKSEKIGKLIEKNLKKARKIFK